MLCCTPQTLAGGDPSTTCRPRCLSPPLASGVDLNLQAKRQTKASCTNKNSGWTSPLLSRLLSALALSPHCTTEHHTCSLSLSRSRVLRSSPDTCTHTTIRQPQDHLLFIRAREASDGRRRGAVSCLDLRISRQPASRNPALQGGEGHTQRPQTRPATSTRLQLYCRPESSKARIVSLLVVPFSPCSHLVSLPLVRRLLHRY
ncbi:hypothetical protein F4823DRAFT_170760 [Ustulina deusta]|nr:hypothetical protein F4823DRAFT_170760 [Ustulina deusta]